MSDYVWATYVVPVSFPDIGNLTDAPPVRRAQDRDVPRRPRRHTRYRCQLEGRVGVPRRRTGHGLGSLAGRPDASHASHASHATDTTLTR